MSNLFKITLASVLAIACIGTSAYAQKTTSKKAKKAATEQKVPERPQRIDPAENARQTAEKVYGYLLGCTPAAVVDGSEAVISDYSKIDADSHFQKGDFGICTYEWGVTYSGMLALSEVTGESKFADYAYERLKLLGDIYPYVKDYYESTGYAMKLKALASPKWLDDCGAMTAAMIKATIADPQKGKDFRALLDNWYNFVMYKEYRLGDGILARNRPTTNSVWLDDMYMGITPIAWRALLMQRERGDLTQKYYNEAVNQVLMFKKYLWVPEKNLFRHGWIEGMEEHPAYHWARANGWAVLTMCDVLDALPERTQGRDEVLALLKSLLAGIAPYQAPDGRWHQLIDKTESYLETSATAMFVYGYAHAINKGWIDRTAYQDIARAGWNAVASQVNAQGQVENTCVGTGLGWTNTFYEGRPVSVYAAHGYGPVLLAAAEMIRMYSGSGEQNPGFGMPGAPGMPREQVRGNGPQVKAGAGQQQMMMPPMMARVERQEGKPMVFLAGDSTCKNGRGTGDNGQWGWGSFFGEYMSDGVVVDNEAVGGLSSRTFYANNWSNIRDSIKEGDFVLIQFGHNDMSPLGTGRARGTLDGTSDEPQKVVMEKNGASEEVYSYGHYIRMMIRQTRMRGGIPVVLSPTPQNSWPSESSVKRFDKTFNAWCEQVAKEEGVLYIDANELIAEQYDKLGKTRAQADYFADSVHTKEAGARLYCQTIADALKASGSPIAKYF